MSRAGNTRHVAVLGGGILGVSTAVHLLREGASVVLVTEAELASGASGRSLSWLNSAGERATPYHQLRMCGIDRYRTLFASDPSRDWLRFDGGLHWADTGSDQDTVARHEYERAHGYDSVLVSPGTVDDHTPGVSRDALGPVAIFNPGEGWVSLPHLIGFLMEEFTSRGGELVTDAGTARVRVGDGRATGIDTDGAGSFPADAVVVACGPQTPAVVAELGVRIPDASPMSMLVTTAPVDHAVRAVLNTPRAAVRPNPGNTLALDHDWYEESITQDADGTYSIPEAVVHELTTRPPDSWRAGRGSPRHPGRSAASPSRATGNPCSGNSGPSPAASSPSRTPGRRSGSSRANSSRVRS